MEQIDNTQINLRTFPRYKHFQDVLRALELDPEIIRRIDVDFNNLPYVRNWYTHLVLHVHHILPPSLLNRITRTNSIYSKTRLIDTALIMDQYDLQRWKIYVVYEEISPNNGREKKLTEVPIKFVRRLYPDARFTGEDLIKMVEEKEQFRMEEPDDDVVFLKLPDYLSKSPPKRKKKVDARKK